MAGDSLRLLVDGLADAVVGGRYDARAFAKMLNWRHKVMARYLEVSEDTVRAGTVAARHQPKLEELAGVVLLLLRAFYGIQASEVPDLSGGSSGEISKARQAVVRRARELAAVWLNTPQPDLDGQRPTELILSGGIAIVRELVADLDDEED